MDYKTLGRTGLRVSRMGLGCGGHSRLGQSTGRSEEESIAVVREAIHLGVNFIDTAEAYRTESIVGRSIRDLARDELVLSTKVHAKDDDRLSSAAEFRSRVLAGLERLAVDYVDILHVHGLSSQDYGYVKTELVPVLQKLQSEGRVRFIGVTEAFAPDPTHRMLTMAAGDEFWDVIMVGFNIPNQSARERVFPWTIEKRVGTLGMFAVRRALSNPDRLRELIRELVDAGSLKASDFDLADPLGFLVAPGVAQTVTEAAYRFCLWEPGMDVVLSGTGNVEHLRENARFLSSPPLPTEITEKLRRLFSGIDTISGN
jgi:aryl-alcohol dehydrogenase-like predicted oxidoreductase